MGPKLSKNIFWINFHEFIASNPMIKLKVIFIFLLKNPLSFGCSFGRSRQYCFIGRWDNQSQPTAAHNSDKGTEAWWKNHQKTSLTPEHTAFLPFIFGLYLSHVHHLDLISKFIIYSVSHNYILTYSLNLDFCMGSQGTQTLGN